MAEKVSQQLMEAIHKLEARIGDLETKLAGGQGKGQGGSAEEGMRMILIGPPGAGEFRRCFVEMVSRVVAY